MRPNKIKIFLEGLSKLQPHLSEVVFQVESNVQLTNSFKLSVLFKNHFQKHCSNISIKQISQEFQQYLTLPPQILGKKSSKIVFSKSHNFCMKQITSNDIIKIEQILNDLQNFKEDPDQCLIDILGIYEMQHSIKGVKINDFYMFMPNIRGDLDLSIRTFDLKGYTQSRQIDEQDFHDFQFGKDLNFIKSQEITMINKQLSKKERRQWLKSIQKNIIFLRERNIIDYSLLISLMKTSNQNKGANQNKNAGEDIKKHKKNQIILKNGIILKWAIIDYFQQYNQKKKMQNKFKSLFKKQISSVEPKLYAERLNSFLMKHLGEN